MRPPSRFQACLILLPMLTSLLASCEQRDPALAVLTPAVSSVLSESSAPARRAAIKAQWRAVCPVPLTDDELEWAAQFVEENRSKGAVWIAGRLLKMDRQTNKCRGKLR